MSIDILIKTFKDKNIDFTTDDSILEKNSRDTSLFKMTPKIVVFPKSKLEISSIVETISKNKDLTLAGRSAGTDMSGGAISPSVIISFTKYLNKVIRIDDNTKEVTVEPGIFYKDFERELLKHKLLLPSFPASREMCAIGGMISNNAGGEKSLQYGKTLEYVEELECILSNGEIVNYGPIGVEELKEKIFNSEDTIFKNTLEYKIHKEMYELLSKEDNKEIIRRNTPVVKKNSAGYYLWEVLKEKDGKEIFDLSRLIVGSQGTLAMISKAKLKLVTPARHSELFLIFLKDLKDLESVREIVMKYSPGSLESYDENTFKVSMKFFPLIIKSVFKHNKSKGKKVNFFKLIFSFWKELKLILIFGMPKLILLAEFTGDSKKDISKTVNACELEIKDKVKSVATRKVLTEYEAEKYWIMRRESFNLLRKKVNGLHTAPFIDDICVKPERLASFLEDLVPILNRYKLFYTIAGHVGEGNIHIIPLMNFETEERKQENIKTIKEASHEVYGLVRKYQGSITAEHNDGLIRTPFLSYMFDEEMLELFKKVKEIFDPKNIFNPGKKVPINKDVDTEFNRNMSFLRKF